MSTPAGRPVVPRTVAIITDGNGRWAQRRGLPVWEGHREGAENVRRRLRDAVELGIEQLSVYAFSTENWSRSADEIDALMGLMKLYIEHETRSSTTRASACASSAAAPGPSRPTSSS